MYKKKIPMKKKDESIKKVKCVIEKPKKLKKEPIDQIIINLDHLMKDPPPTFCSVLDKMNQRR